MNVKEAPEMEMPAIAPRDFGILYSNLDHSFDQELLKDAEETGSWYQHAAWDFCGFVRFDRENSVWVEQVWVYGRCVEIRKEKGLKKLIDSVNNSYGHG